VRVVVVPVSVSEMRSAPHGPPDTSSLLRLLVLSRPLPESSSPVCFPASITSSLDADEADDAIADLGACLSISPELAAARNAA
jgi:hypothetical protein